MLSPEQSAMNAAAATDGVGADRGAPSVTQA